VIAKGKGLKEIVFILLNIYLKRIVNSEMKEVLR